MTIARVSNRSRAARELRLDERNYSADVGRGPGYDGGGSPLQPAARSVMLPARETTDVDADFLTAVRAAHAHVEAWFQQRVLVVTALVEEP